MKELRAAQPSLEPKHGEEMRPYLEQLRGRSAESCSPFRVWTEYTDYAGRAIQNVHDVMARDEFWAGLEAQERHPVHVVDIVRVEPILSEQPLSET